MLMVENLSAGYGSRQILNNLTFSLEKGQSVCLLGKNGVGKTTLFRAILNTISYTGEISVNGQNIQALSRNALAQEIAYIPQSKGNDVEFSVYEMILMGTTPRLKHYQQPGEAEREAVLNVMKRLNIEYLKEAVFSQISGGEQQLVTIARAIVQEARVIIMDEPCANLDYGNQIMVLEMVRQLASQGYLVIQSTHDPNHALQYGDKVLMIEKGEISLFGNPVEVLTGEKLSHLYQTPIQVVTINQEENKQSFCLPKKGEEYVGNL